MAVLFAQAGPADPRDFSLENDSSSSLPRVYIVPTSSDSCGDDILDADVLPSGESVDIIFDANVEEPASTIFS